jgi:putative restriction endonuclease
MRNIKWTREQLILAYNLYCKISFGKIHNRNPEIIDLAKLIGRTPSALSWKLANFARLDPNLKKRKIAGASHGSKGEEEIWNEFQNNWEELIFQSELLLARFKNLTIEKYANIPIDEIPKEGKTRLQIIKVRVNQNFFRTTILSAYNNSCAVTGLKIPELLVAGHIIPWSENEKERLNPRNGICLNVLHEKAFDRGLISFSDDFKVLVSSKVPKDETNELILKYAGSQLNLPDKFLPDLKFLEYHRKHTYKR